MNTRRSVSWIMLSLAIGLGAAACGSNGGSSSSAPSASPSSQSAPAAATPTAAATPSASSPTSGAAAKQAIKANWTAFFSPKTSAAQKARLLQDAAQFASALAAGNPQASASSARVTKVTITSPSKATVVYDILLSGTPVLTNQKGTAVYQDGVWKVSVTSFCGLLTLESGGKTSSLPPICKSAG